MIKLDNNNEKIGSFQVVNNILGLQGHYDKDTQNKLLAHLTSMTKRHYVNELLAANFTCLGVFDRNGLAKALFEHCVSQLRNRTEVNKTFAS